MQKGKIEANFYLGTLYDWFSYPEQDNEKAKSYYEAAGDNPYAKLALGFLYCNGHGVEADTAKGGGRNCSIPLSQTVVWKVILENPLYKT